MSSLPDGLSVGALIVATISGCMMFIKTIKKCKFSKSQGFELERDIDKDSKDIASQQEFMINLIKTLQQQNTLKTKSPRRCSSDDSLPWNTSKVNLHPQPILINPHTIPHTVVNIPQYRTPKIPVQDDIPTTSKPIHQLLITNNRNKETHHL